MNLNEQLLNQRTKKDLSIEALANLMNETPETIKAWEQGNLVPTQDQLRALSFILEIPLTSSQRIMRTILRIIKIGLVIGILVLFFAIPYLLTK